ncbi:Eukaryotic translation initiation factor 2 alpha kinase 4 [Xylographa trunciseda]|nr:Eukaryotic translation initiation factor 2 alpha kinase 4 [Xylographa trunciseda]
MNAQEEDSSPLNSNAEHTGVPSSDTNETWPRPRHPSIMRVFLESNLDCKWSHGKSYINFRKGPTPLKIEGKIESRTSEIDIFRAPPDTTFPSVFVVKTIKRTDLYDSVQKTNREVGNMRGLFHPHVVAFLGRFKLEGRLSIMMFPVAHCDLGIYMAYLSHEREPSLDDDPFIPPSSIRLKRIASTDSSTSNESVREYRRLYDPDYRKRFETDSEIRIECLKQFFVCLCQALSYLHEAGVRHKDIKPANILIDASGSILLTDFGISKRFLPNSPLITHGTPEYTEMYACPEMMDARTSGRDDKSDVFSLGCVFLEMATLILGRSLGEFKAVRCTMVNEIKKEAYYCNLQDVYAWIDTLEGETPSRSGKHNADVTPGTSEALVGSLSTIREMLNRDPEPRPSSRDLWQAFEHVAPIICRDCDVRLPMECRWKPSPKQQREFEASLERRAKEEEQDNRDAEAARLQQIAKAKEEEAARKKANAIREAQARRAGSSSQLIDEGLVASQVQTTIRFRNGILNPCG